MERSFVADVVERRGFEPEYLVKVMAYVETKTILETLAKVLQLLEEAAKRSCSCREVLEIVNRWYSAFEEEHRMRIEDLDPWYRSAMDMVEKIEKQGS